MRKPIDYDLIVPNAVLHCLSGVSGTGKSTFMQDDESLGKLDTALKHVGFYRIKADTKSILEEGAGDLEATLRAYATQMEYSISASGRRVRHYMTDRSPLCYTTHNIVDRMGAEDFAAFPRVIEDSPMVASALTMLADFADNSEYFYVEMHPIMYPETNGSVRNTIETRVRANRHLQDRVANCPAFKNYIKHTKPHVDVAQTVIDFLEKLEKYQARLRTLAPIRL